MQEGPLTWWLLVLAHLLPAADVPVPLSRLVTLLEQLPSFPGQDQQDPPGTGQLLEALASVPGVRLSQRGDDAAGPDADGEPTWIALQPELRQLLRQAWEQLDPDGRFRRALSRAVLSVLSAAEQQALSEAAWQASRLERLHHQLTLDLEEGLRCFQRLFGPATAGWRRSFARTLLETVRECEPLLTSPQRWQLRVWEAQLLRLEEQPHLAQALLERLQQEADPS
jgi:hypothetical protein